MVSGFIVIVICVVSVTIATIRLLVLLSFVLLFSYCYGYDSSCFLDMIVQLLYRVRGPECQVVKGLPQAAKPLNPKPLSPWTILVMPCSGLLWMSNIVFVYLCRLSPGKPPKPLNPTP